MLKISKNNLSISPVEFEIKPTPGNIEEIIIDQACKQNGTASVGVWYTLVIILDLFWSLFGSQVSILF